MTDNENNTVWYKLFVGDGKKGRVGKVMLPKGADVYDLQKKIKEEERPKLDFYAASDLDVYSSGTTDPTSTDALDPGVPVPLDGNASNAALVVVAPPLPPPPQQQKPNGKYSCIQLLPWVLLSFKKRIPLFLIFV
jgi:hypothetical protein